MTSGGSLGQKPESSYPAVSDLAREFTYQEFVEATENFDPIHILREGGFGQVFGGKLPNEKAIAVKRLTRDDPEVSGLIWTPKIQVFESLFDVLSCSGVVIGGWAGYTG
jgi:hypothetical protein